VRGVEEAGLRVDLEVSGERRDLPAAVELTVYRVVQEGLTNVIRHARATRASVSVAVGRSLVEVTVEDDGAGRGAVASGASTGDGSGLRGLTERVRALRGTLTAGNRSGGGFRLHATLPVSEGSR
jgi:signal transduction histidine kinase